MSTAQALNYLLPIDAVAEALGVSRYTVRRLIESEAIKSVRIAARVMVANTEVERILREGCGTSKRRRQRERRIRRG